MEGMYSNVQPGMIGLEMSLHHNGAAAAATRNGSHQPIPHHPMGPYDPHAHSSPAAADYPQVQPKPQQQPPAAYPFAAAKSKTQALTLSDDDDPAAGFTPENSADDGSRRQLASSSSPWQRMKWTDNMVRLLIMVVFYIGDEVGSEGAADPAAIKKKGGAGGAGGGGVLQKKGKWKSVSRAMMERGFYVSPQQCEDKFNDLNKRYKRVNDILGKGTACRVVENQSLLDAMDHLSPKTKDEVKKLLNSKHLFFREMCAYHNSCGHATAPAAAHQPEASQCLHSTETPPNLNESSKLGNNDDGEEDDDEDDDDDNDDDDEDNEDDLEASNSNPRKRIRIHKETSTAAAAAAITSPLLQQLGSEVVAVLQDGARSASEKIHWMKVKQVQLEEQRVGIHSQSVELEKQRLKWLKFSGKKEREMERQKVENERKKVENERMVLLIKQKELDMMDIHGNLLHHHHHNNHNQNQSSGGNRKSDPPTGTITG